MNIVYVEEFEQYECGVVLGVFSTEKKARSFIEGLGRIKTQNWFEVTTFKVDAIGDDAIVDTYDISAENWDNFFGE